jgi:hypothetical protein
MPFSEPPAITEVVTAYLFNPRGENNDKRDREASETHYLSPETIIIIEFDT